MPLIRTDIPMQTARPIGYPSETQARPSWRIPTMIAIPEPNVEYTLSAMPTIPLAGNEQQVGE